MQWPQQLSYATAATSNGTLQQQTCVQQQLQVTAVGIWSCCCGHLELLQL
jgi:hypothetical protein